MPDWFIYFIAAIVVGIIALIMLRMAWRAGRRALWMKRYNDVEMVNAMMAGRIARGMTMDMVVDVWGIPADLDEVVMKTKTKHEMKYDEKGKNRYGTRVYLEDEIVVGWETK
ncbi:hypothetical protein [Paramylibacter kogurei]|nr:hypothetical protein [Amylibacter kogurei]